MDELPLHVFLKVLDHLPTLDAIRCRVVCKFWLELIDKFVLDELNVFHGERQHRKYFQFRKCFLNPNRSISFGDIPFDELVIENEHFGQLFRNLKKFAYQHSITSGTLGEKKYRELGRLINTFVNLEHLYLAGISLLSINLQKLKTFDCAFLNQENWAEKGRKVLDCPELQALAIDWVETETPILKCPKLQYLKYVHYAPWISELDSLEVLNLWCLKANSNDILNNHPNLHTLNVFKMENLEELEELVGSRKQLRRIHLKIFVKSLPVDGELLKAFDEIFDNLWWRLGYFTAKGVELYAKHEQEFRDDFFVFGENEWIFIDEETIANLKLLTDRTPIFRKIRRVHGLAIEGQSLSQEEVINLVKQMPNVQRLSCSGVCLDQTFFDQLPASLKFLRMLHISRNSITPGDLSFILKLRDLHVFIANQGLFYCGNLPIMNAFAKKKALDFLTQKLASRCIEDNDNLFTFLKPLLKGVFSTNFNKRIC